MEKSKIAGGIIILVMAVVIVFMSLPGDSSDKETTSEATVESVTDVEPEEKAEIAEPEKEEITEEQTSTFEDYMKDSAGIVYNTENGLSIEVTGAGILSNGIVKDLIYVTADITNDSDTAQEIHQDTALYIDDYQHDTLDTTDLQLEELDGETYYIDLDPGRKCKYIFYTDIPEDAYNANKVEFEFYDINMVFRDNGEWKYNTLTSDSDTTESEEVSSTSTATSIGNPIIDADPSRYIPEGISGEIDAIDGTFYSNKPVIGIIPGEYLIVGGGNAVVNISEDGTMSLSFIDSTVDFRDAEMEELINSDIGCSYQVYGNNTGYVVSFYEGGLYLYTDHTDDEADYAEGFYQLLD